MNAKSRVAILFSLLVVVNLLFVGSAQADASPANLSNFDPQECWFEKPVPFLPGPEFECGYVSVPERHENPQGPQIRIPVAIARAQANDVKPDPLFLAQGGPGGDAFEVFSVLLGASSIWKDRDVVVFNQRGTRYSEPDLSCTESMDAAVDLLSLPEDEGERRSLELLKTCYDRLTADGVDISAYNSVQNAADVNAIRKALGYDEYNFYGVSYGTLLGLHLLRDQQEGLRSVILDGVVPTNLNFIPRVAANTDRVFSEIIETCEQDAMCRSQYPDLEKRFFDLVEHLNNSPTTVKMEDPETGRRTEALLDGDTLVNVLFQAFYLPDSYAYFPKLVANLEDGDLTFVEGMWPLFAFDRSISEGMYYSVICSEDADFDESETVVDGIHPYFAGSALEDLQSYTDACEIWQVEQLPDSVDDAVVSDIPALLLSGHYDPITPPYFAQLVSDSLTNDVNVVHPTGSHGVAFGEPCLDQILTQFLDTPQADIDTSCLEQIKPKDFAPADAISFPIVGEINQLSDSVLRQIGLSALFLLIIWSAFVILPLAWLIKVFSRKEAVVEVDESKRLRWIAGILVLVFGFLAIIFVSGVTYYTFDSLFSGLAMILAVSSAAAPFFLIPLILTALALLLLIITIVAWRRGYWATWARLYYSVLAIAAVAYITILAYSDILTVLF